MDSNSEHHNPPQAGLEISKDKRIIEGRRSFFLWLVAVGTAAMGAALAIPVIRYVLYPVFATTTSRSWSSLGKSGDYASIAAPVRKDVDIKQVDGWRESISRKPVYVTKGKRKPSINDTEVLTAVCPHLGCDVPWNAAEGKFMCPCHGSVFRADGSVIRGPARRGMDTLLIKTEGNDFMVRYEYFQALLSYKKEVG